jgi:hypothetical protein
MTPDELLSLEDNPNYIEGIYNYCDRWCERCPMTHRCLLYASTPSDENLIEGSVEDLKHAMMRQVEASFTLTIDLLNKIAAERGIDLSDSSKTENPIREHERQRKDADKSALTRQAKQYLDNSKNWFDHCDTVILAKDKEFEQAARMQLPGRDLARETQELKNAMDVIHWYQFQIVVKLVRSQTSRMRQIDWDDDVEPMPKDSDGSAKVALIGIDRSIGAWGMMLQALPDQEDKILDILKILDRLRRMTEEEFPAARSFKRAGFDD